MSMSPPDAMSAACDSCGMGSDGGSIDLVSLVLGFLAAFLVEVVFFFSSMLAEGGVGRFGMVAIARNVAQIFSGSSIFFKFVNFEYIRGMRDEG